MPVHDWSRVDAGTFHDFHQGWTVAIRNSLNSGGLPDGFYAMTDQILGGPIPDVTTIRQPTKVNEPPRTGGTAIAERPPQARFRQVADSNVYATRANRIAIRHRYGDVVAIIEIVSPGNKNSRNALRQFVEKARDFLDKGVHLLIVDLFGPSARDPHGIHKVIWDEVQEETFEPPADKPLTVVSYYAGEPKTAYVEPIAVGDVLPMLPIFLSAETYVPAPLEATYLATWAVSPPPVKEILG